MIMMVLWLSRIWYFFLCTKNKNKIDHILGSHNIFSFGSERQNNDMQWSVKGLKQERKGYSNILPGSKGNNDINEPDEISGSIFLPGQKEEGGQQEKIWFSSSWEDDNQRRVLVVVGSNCQVGSLYYEQTVNNVIKK